MKYAIHNSRFYRFQIEVHQNGECVGNYSTIDEFLSTRPESEDIQIVQNTSYDQDPISDIQVRLPDSTKIANTFIAVLQAWLTPDEMQSVRVRNSNEKDSGTCHSHDFCDANMAMDKAFNLHGIKVDIQSDAHQELWNSAWDTAKGNNFRFINS